MKQYDKNSLIGFVLMAIILIIFNTFFFPDPLVDEKNTIPLTEEDTYIIEKKDTEAIIQIPTSINKSAISEELKLTYGVFANTAIGEEEYEVLENDKLKITISNKGGRITSVILKEYQTYDSLPLELFNADSSRFNLQFTTGHNINTANLYFEAEKSSNSVSMKLKADNNHYVEYVYSISSDYLVDFNINMIGMEDLIPIGVNYMNLEWQMKTPQTEKSKSNQDMYTGIYYQEKSNNEVDYLSLTSSDEEEVNAKLNWVSFKQQFFSAIFISENGFNKPTILVSNKNEHSKFIKDLSAKFELPYTHRRDEQLNYKFFFGPNHYKTLESYNSGFEELIPLGWGIFGWVNQYIIINIFDFLSKYMSNYGLIILLLTIIIKLALSPFTYKAYLSQAKMKVLKPEIDKLNEKNKGKDQMKIQQETMNVYRKAGVNPMGGCLPMLFQFPILIAMFRFFPASIELRQESFLWADDLSAYDSIYNLGFEIPFYGDHISLFTLLMTISTLLYTRMNASMATGQMAQMKWMMYLMPIMFLGFFNNYAAGLSYYYFLANMFTFGQQYFMKKFIDEDAILSQLEENKKKPKKKSKFQKKLEEMQRKQEEQMRKRSK
ncbi:MAG: membrane protein insertase YidC [Flavobacteriales bacterium]|nr:membrane protein insertase YidC [Flavobacteriales bacterium]|tara:strand:- start:8355 stop:10169 length:1815 start_codon:yes stop_codon:yes gene_type:complete